MSKRNVYHFPRVYEGKGRGVSFLATAFSTIPPSTTHVGFVIVLIVMAPLSASPRANATADIGVRRSEGRQREQRVYSERGESSHGVAPQKANKY